MKKRKKNNKPLIILVVGLLVFGSLLGVGFYKLSEHKKFLVEDKKEFDKKIVEEKISCNEKIAQAKKDIEKYELDIEKIDREVTLLQRQKTDEFMNSTGFSKKYYELEDKITAKRKEQTKIRSEISNKRSEITKLENTIWKIDNEWDSYRYKNPGFQKGNPLLFFSLGSLGLVATFISAGCSLLVKKVSSEKSYSEHNEIDEGVLSEIDVNEGMLIKKELFEKTKQLLLASSKDDKDTIRKLCTKNMAKSYIDEIELLKKHKQKLVIKDIENVDSKIVDVDKDQHNTVIVLVQKVKMYDYTKDVTTNEIIDGNDKKKQEKAFKLVFVKDFGKGHNVKKCPNCGANIKDASKVACDYCGTLFDDSNYDWYLASKVIISED